MAATTKLIVWNAALREIGGAPLADTTTANTRQYELNAAWDHAIEYALSLKDWGFARRRSSLTGVADTSFSPYTYRYTKPSDYLRKCWIKTTANDDYQVDHAEIAAVFYGMQSTALLEYVSDHADNYDPANWPPHFTRVLTLYLASLVAPKLARAGADDLGRLNGQMKEALVGAEDFESVFLTNTSIATERQPVFRRALEFMGQTLAGSVPVHSQADKLRWHMNRAFSHCTKYVLELGAWNFATQRVVFQNGDNANAVVPSTSGGVIEGYSVAPAVDDTSDTPLTEYEYGFPKPDDFLHKIWIKADPNNVFEIRHQFAGDYILVNNDPCVMEYVAENSFTTNPDNWSANFLEAVAAYIALTVSPELMLETGGKRATITANDVRMKLESVFQSKLSDARLRDAIQQYPHEIPLGRFARARSGGTYNLLRRN